VLEALKILSSPDRRRKEVQVFDGRRVEAVEDGWFVLNGSKYRDMVSVEMKRARDRRAAKAYRERNKSKTKAQVSREYGNGEKAYEKSINNGESDGKAMKRAEEVHPLPERMVYEDDPPDNF
jgi:hypothetical protein